MNLGEIRQVLGEQSGCYGLFQDAQNADFSDKTGLKSNATYYINAGIRYLDRRWSMAGTSRRRAYSVAADQWNFAVSNADFIRRIDLTTSAGVVSRLENKTYQQLRDHYAKEWASVTAGKPLYWAIVPEDENIGELIDANFLAEPAEKEIVEIDDFLAELLELPNVWIAAPSASWSWAQGLSTWSDEGLLYSYLGASFDANVSVSIDLSVTDGQVEVGLVYISSDGITEAASSSGILASGSITLSPTGPWNTIYIRSEPPVDGGDCAGSVSRVFIEALRTYNIVTMPPSDAAYTLNVFGDFANNPLEGDLDTNFWTETHPELVVRAARLQLEMDGHRNVSGMTAFQTQVEGEIERIFANDQFAYISGYTWQEACIRG